MRSGTALLADIGGTNTRFALLDQAGRIGAPDVFPTAAHDTLEAAIQHWMDRTGQRPDALALAVAGPVTGDAVALTNHPWRFSASGLAARFGFAPVCVMNDVAAIARALPDLPESAFLPLKPGTANPAAARLVVAPGTGLGVAALIPAGSSFHVASSEGGHVTLAARDVAEAALLEKLRPDGGHLSAEDVLAAPGLARLYQALSGREATPEEVTAAALGCGDPQAKTAASAHSAMLGGIAGDLAMSFDARAGVVIAGDLPGRMGPAFDRDAFIRRFTDKGPFTAYLEAIPVSLLDAAYPAFTGLAASLGDQPNRPVT
ncbi:glucokinase [Oceanibaculum indicum]|uniref:Glucokinase n=1 Tax=Oceanibaculum indicum TaxID=526216 RepID=A0A420WI36_9PROT|nr:ROK family protein [Oceanibaculum indicum]RKQ70681.1 glucokinase [Oceanibaculum indicum]